MTKFFKKLWKDESGISSVEYALLLSFIAAGIVLAADLLGTAVGNEINGAANCVSSDSANINTDCNF